MGNYNSNKATQNSSQRDKDRKFEGKFNTRRNNYSANSDKFDLQKDLNQLDKMLNETFSTLVRKEVETNITIADATMKRASATTFPSALTYSDTKFLDQITPALMPLSDLSLRKYELTGIPGVRYMNIISDYSFMRMFNKFDNTKKIPNGKVDILLTTNQDERNHIVNKTLLESADRHAHSLRAVLGRSSAKEIRAAQLEFLDMSADITPQNYVSSHKKLYSNGINISPYTYLMANIQSEFIYVTNFISQYFEIITNAMALQRKFPLFKDAIASLTNMMQKKDITQTFTAIISTINMIKYNSLEYTKVSRMSRWGSPTKGVDSEIKHHQLNIAKIKLPDNVELVSAAGPNEIVQYDKTILEQPRTLDLFHQFMIAMTKPENENAKVATDTIRNIINPLVGWASKIRPLIDMITVMEDVLTEFNVNSSYRKGIKIEVNYSDTRDLEDAPLLDAYLDFISTSKLDYDVDNMYYINETMAFSAPKVRSQLALSQHFFPYIPINHNFNDNMKQDRSFSNFNFRSIQLIVSDIPSFRDRLSIDFNPETPGANIVYNAKRDIIEIDFYAQKDDKTTIDTYSTSASILSRIFSNLAVKVNVYDDIDDNQAGLDKLTNLKTKHQIVLTHPSYLIDVKDTWHKVTPALEKDVLNTVLPYVESFGS